MKRILVFIILVASFGQLFAGGLVTNTNQSSMFTRLMCRDATLGLDAVYFNPAGLGRYEEGFYLHFSNQFINQTQTISSDYSYLTNAPVTYEGIVKAPLFPNVYAAYKIGDIVISGGFMPIGGGGGAEFSTGLPSFEMMVADLVPYLSSQINLVDMGIYNVIQTDPGFRNISGYNADIYFKGSSIYFGYQANVSYAVSDDLAIAIGARLVQAKNTYAGSVSNVKIDAPSAYGGTQTPGDYLRFIANTPYIGPTSAIGMGLLASADDLDVQTQLEADVVRKGTGITPVISLNYSPGKKLNLAFKYEFKTKLELGTTINDGKDAGGLFTEEAVVADMPAMVSLGGTFTPGKKLMISTGLHYYFDKDNDYDGSYTVEVVMIDKNSLEYALGLEYGLADFLKVSAGWLMTRTGVNDLYQSDQRFSLNTNTFGGGVSIKILKNMDLDLGGSYTIYEDGAEGFPYTNLAQEKMTVNQTYDKSVWVVSAGISMAFEY